MVPSTPGARTVTAGPAMRRSGCMARIAGSMKPQLRKWPMVAGSALTSFWTRRASREEGRGLRVNTAELLDVGERAIAQPADIAAGVDHVIAALEHLAPGGAGRRHADHGGAMGRGRHRLQRMEQRRGLAEAMFLVEQQVVEAAKREQLDHRRRAEHGPAAERALAGSQPRLESVWAKHGPSIQFRGHA